jgi:cell wall-associated NlpC family hydrolase
MESKYSAKKRKTYIACSLPGGVVDCPLPVRVPENSYMEMLASLHASRGTRYRFGGNDPEGFDCSGFVQYLYSISFQMLLPRTSHDLALLGSIIPRKSLKRGDLVFFSSGGSRIDHVGIFLGNGSFAHAATSTGVTVSRIQEKYYDARYAFGSRIITVD